MAAPTARTAVRPSPGVEAVPPVTPNLVRAKEVPGARQVGRNTFETLFFRGLSTPIALLLVVIQSRFLDPAGRGRFVLVVLTVTILARLFGQLGVAVTSYADERALRPLVQRALAQAFVLGLGGLVLILVAGVVIDAFGLRLAAIAAPALIPNIVNACISGVLLGRARIRLWNYIQALPPLLTLVGMLIVVVGLGHGVDGAIATWTIAYFLTAAFALVATRDLWSPPVVPRMLDRHGRALARLALVMGAVQIVNLIGYRIELFVLDRYDGLAAVGIYSIAMQAAEAMWLVPAAIATALTGPDGARERRAGGNADQERGRPSPALHRGDRSRGRRSRTLPHPPALRRGFQGRLAAAGPAAAGCRRVRARGDSRRLPLDPSRAAEPQPPRLGRGARRDRRGFVPLHSAVRRLRCRSCQRCRLRRRGPCGVAVVRSSGRPDGTGPAPGFTGSRVGDQGGHGNRQRARHRTSP
jgi:hypothetical protein